LSFGFSNTGVTIRKADNAVSEGADFEVYHPTESKNWTDFTKFG